MNNIISFFKLIRFNNLIIVALTQLIVKFSLINPFLDNIRGAQRFKKLLEKIKHERAQFEV